MAAAEALAGVQAHAAFFVESVTVRNFKGIEHLELELRPGLSLLVGRNNAGKSRLLRALHIAVGGVPVDRDDLTVGSDEPAEIDVVIAPSPAAAVTSGAQVTPDAQTGVRDELFDPALQPVWGDALAVVSDSPIRQRFAWRTTITSTGEGAGARYESQVMRFSVTAGTWEATNRALDRQARHLLHAELVDTRRDLDAELRQRGTAIRRILNDLQVQGTEREALEQRLADLGGEILQHSRTLGGLRDSLDSLDRYVDALGPTRVDPVPRTLEELARTVGVSFGDGTDHLASRLHGSGVRSLASLLVQDVFYREALGVDGGDIRPHPITLIEEPETHLHPHAVIEVATLLEAGGRQVVATTHSPLLATSVTPESIVLVRRSLEGAYATVGFGPAEDDIDDSRRTKQPTFYASEMEKLTRLAERPFGDLLFASAIVVGDGATERAFLPPVLREALGPLAHGISVVDSVGMNHQLVGAVIKFARHAEVPLVIFADDDSAGRAGAEHFAVDQQLDTSREVVWSGQVQQQASASESAQAGAVEKLMIGAAPDACRAACEALGRPVAQSEQLLAVMKDLKGSIGAPLAKEFVARHPYADGTGWPEPLRRLADLLRARLGPVPEDDGGDE